jgi:hypothetical protein
MSEQKRAAIDIDKLGDKKLSEISAADFMAALDAGGVKLDHLTLWPEKKKVELWAEPENYVKIRVIDIIRVIRTEKKKVELEKFPGFEMWRDPREQVYDELLNRLARDLETKFRVGR